MSLLVPEVRLAVALLMNAAILLAAWRFVRRAGARSRAQSFGDTLLLWLMAQYVVVGALGAVGLLSATGLVAGALVAAALLWWGGSRLGKPAPAEENHWGMAWLLFICGYALAYAHGGSLLVPWATDVLVYHFPAAVAWLQTGRITLHQTWFFNPANTYSPLAGSAFVCWLLAPMGNDLLARFVQLAPFVLTFAAMMQLGAALGARPVAAGLIAAAMAASSPFFHQALLQKDDLFVTAFFLCAVAGLAPDRIGDRLGPWRIGAAVGLMLATKYTAVLSVPILLLAADGPIRLGWRGRQWGIVLGLVLVLAGPWYLRNLILTGNPVFPVAVTLGGSTLFPGLFVVAPSPTLRTPTGLWGVLSEQTYGIPLAVALLLAVGWLGGAAAWLRRRPIRARLLAGSPGAATQHLGKTRGDGPDHAGWLVRLCVLGPALGFLLFWTRAPYPEVRFVLPSFALLFACWALAQATWVRAGLFPQAFVGAVPLIAAALTAAPWAYLHLVGKVLLAGVVVAVCGSALLALQDRRLHWPARRWAVGLLAVVLLLAALVYVLLPGYTLACQLARRDAWERMYGGLAKLWTRLDEPDVPAGAVVAYTNSPLVYPLYGFDLSRRVVHAPTRPGIQRLDQLPRLGNGPLDSSQIAGAVHEAIWQTPDRDVWLANLRSLGAQWLVVVTQGHHPLPPPEMAFARSDPARFQPVSSSAAGVIYRIRWDTSDVATDAR